MNSTTFFQFFTATPTGFEGTPQVVRHRPLYLNDIADWDDVEKLNAIWLIVFRCVFELVWHVTGLMCFILGMECFIWMMRAASDLCVFTARLSKQQQS
jgi:hypothetical protein